ncbi:MAG: deoxyribodipyrimidine photo-lyase [Methanothrix sp.]|nr:MAG: deoxyribodipyrimidine photo-lyase [Methanothrix sp.]
MPVNPKRVRRLIEAEQKSGPVIYWMSRDQRAKDNWALLFAQELAQKRGSPLAVAFCLVPEFLGAASRHYDFMLRGLKELEMNLSALNIPFFLLMGDPGKKIPYFLAEQNAGALVSDFSPLRQSLEWKNNVSREATGNAKIPFYDVDSHNIVPCWLASPKAEWAAYTFRPKINRLLGEFLVEFPHLQKHPNRWENEPENDWAAAQKSTKSDIMPESSAIDLIKPGEAAAFGRLQDFVDHKLSAYDLQRNDPNLDGQSNLSPYLHFGQISGQRVALQVLAGMTDASAFLEELIVRRELSDNSCYYNPNYDSVQGFPNWAKETLDKHASDRREYLYTQEELESARTHDDLWNAAQMEMVCRGKMHGYLRMYWAKKILEWTQSPREALRSAIYLNDRYELDGRDPNGYVGIGWSIGGVHDRAWRERAVFGKVRYMSNAGMKKKFDVQRYINSINHLLEIC